MIVSLPVAKSHLRVDGIDSDTLISLYVGAAGQAAAEYLNRKLYADQNALDDAVAAVPAALTAATAAKTAADAAAALLTDADEQHAAYATAENTHNAAHTTARETRAGMVINNAVTAAVLLTLGDLFALREDSIVGAGVTAIPMGARALMQPYRVLMGV